MPSNTVNQEEQERAGQKKAAIHVRVRPELKERFKEACREKDMSESFVITQLIRCFLQEEEAGAQGNVA